MAKNATPESEKLENEYPDDLHPGLVPGIGIDEQRRRFNLDRGLFSITAFLIVAFITWGLISPESVSVVSNAAFSWAMENVGWLLNLVLIASFVVMFYLAFSRFGSIKLGRDDETPEFSRFAWVAMMFAAGIGVGIFFFGPSEPMFYYLSPPPETVDAETPAAIHQAMAQSHFHWGLPAWSLYALVGGAMAYSMYRRGRSSLISSIFAPWLGTEANSTFTGRLIDMLSIVATLFGTAATLGITATQIGQGVQLVAGLGEIGNSLLLIIMGVLTIGFIISAVSGVSKGIRYLSNINMTLTGLAVLFVFIMGPSLYLLNLIPSGTLVYIDEFFSMLSKSLSWGQDALDFQSAWTAFYWAWWISWAPFVGMFIARISRGRTLREFALVCMLAPTFILIIAFTIYGGTAISFAQEGRPLFDGSLSSEAVLFAMYEQFPAYGVTSILLLFILAVFFITSADSASTVMGTMSSRGNPLPNKLIVAFWGICMAGIAAVMLLAGGEESLSALQSLTIIVAMPFALVVLAILVSFLRDLSTDPAAIRRTYAKSAVENAVVRGIEEHGDDFELAVKYAPGERGAGYEFDSTSVEVTEWYRRTDEDGNEVAYDYDTDTWGDGWVDESAEAADDEGTQTKD